MVPHDLEILSAVAAGAVSTLTALRAGGAFRRRILIVGTGRLAARVIDAIARHPEGRYQAIGTVGNAVAGTDGLAPAAPWLGPMDRLGRIIDATRPSTIVLTIENVASVPNGPLLEARGRGIQVEEADWFLEHLTGKIAIEAIRPAKLILSEGFRHVDGESRDASTVLTRWVSLALAACGLILLSPLIGIIAVAIRLDTRGPIFFIQPRIGRAGRQFRLFKFRTMAAGESQGSLWVRDNEDRITRVGRLLRRFRLDEIPQFVNVLRGDMNLVGPRPHPVSNYELFRTYIPYYDLRGVVRPGLTGWAQVRYGYANGLEEETEKMRYDLYYIKHRGLALDLWILAETVIAVALPPADRASEQLGAEDAFHRRWSHSI